MSEARQQAQEKRVSKYVELIKQQRREQQRQASYQTEKAAKLGTKAGRANKNVYDAQKGLTRFLKNTNRINTTQARNYKKIQENQIKIVENELKQVSQNKDQYSLRSYNVYKNKVDKYLNEANKNLTKINQAITKGKNVNISYNQQIKALEKASLRPQIKTPIKYKTSPLKKPTTSLNTVESENTEPSGFLGKIIKTATDYTSKKKYYENLADYETTIGVNDLKGKDRDKNINKIKARFAHMSMATAEAFTKALPLTALAAAGGPFGATTAGLVGVASVATMINPVNRKQLNEYVEQHPQEFIATINGALLAGVSVHQVKASFKEYTKGVKLAKRRELETQFDKLIDDYAYLEQKQGAEFPSRAIEVPTANGKKIWISDPVNPDEEIIYNFMVRSAQKNPKDLWESFLKTAKTENLACYYDAGGGRLESVTIPELVKKYPGLKDPYFNPLINDPNILNKAEIVARNPRGESFNPLLVNALVLVSKQGYITDEQLKEIINQNEKTLDKLKQEKTQIPSDFSSSDLKSISIQDINSVLEQKQEQKETPIVALITPTEASAEIKDPTPDPEPIPPTSPITLTKEDEEELKRNKLKLYNGPTQNFKVTFHYQRGLKEEKTVPARSYPEALNKAQRTQKPTKSSLKVIDIEVIDP